jgi:hypothetical protein
MEPIDPQGVGNSLEDCRHQDHFMRTENSFDVRADDKYTRSVECVVLMIIGGRIPIIHQMTTDEYGLQSMKDTDPMDLRMSSRQWELQGLMSLGKALDHVSMYGTDLSDEENAENMYQMFVNLPAEVITQEVSKIHEDFSEFFHTEYFNGEPNNKGGALALLRGIQQCLIDIQNRCVRATDELSRLVIETAGQRPATLKDLRTQELALEMQTLLWEFSKFQPIRTHQEEIAKKLCRFDKKVPN